MPNNLSTSVSSDDGVVISLAMKAEDTRLALAKRVLQHMREQVDALERLLVEHESSDALQGLAETTESWRAATQRRVLDGVFDGQHMVAEDGAKYLVPPNYASKSKLVEGDLLRLVIADNGRFIFKQRGPIERERLMGTLIYNEQTEEWFVLADQRKFKILPASVSFYKAASQDEAVILVPRDNPSAWAALENVIRRSLSDFGV